MKSWLAILVFASTAPAQDYIRSHADQFGLDARPLTTLGDLDGDGLREYAVRDSNGQFGGARVYSGGSGLLLLSIDGNVATGPIGMAIAPVRDLDGDGVDELLLSGVGVAYAHSGINGALLRTFTSTVTVPGQFYNASSVAAIGDLDGDQVDDVLLSTPETVVGWQCSAQMLGNGFVEVFSGASGALIHAIAGPTVLSNGAPIKGFGGDVSTLGDIDLDGIDDFAVSSRSQPHAGAGAFVALYSGAGGALLRVIQLPGHSYFGGAMAVLDDLDGDGANDLAIADSHARSVRVYSSSTGLQLFATGAPPLSSLYDYFGADLDTVSDWDGDGKRDIVVGSPQAPDVVCGYPGGYPSSSGYAMVVSSQSGVTLATVPNRGELRFGRGVAGLDDLDGDGKGEILIGAPYSYSRVVSSRPEFSQPTQFCPSSSDITATGSTSIAADDLALHLYAPDFPGTKGVFFVGAQALGAGGLFEGGLCVAAPRVRLGPLFTTNAQGEARLNLHPASNPAFSAGQTLFFQAWLRAPGTPRFSTALGLTLTP